MRNIKGKEIYMVYIEMGNMLPYKELVAVEITEEGVNLAVLLDRFPPNYRGAVVTYVHDLFLEDNFEGLEKTDFTEKDIDEIFLKFSRKGLKYLRNAEYYVKKDLFACKCCGRMRCGNR
jgi:hypothetical protein